MSLCKEGLEAAQLTLHVRQSIGNNNRIFDRKMLESLILLTMRICLMNGYANKSDLIRDGKEYRTLKSYMYNKQHVHIFWLYK